MGPKNVKQLLSMSNLPSSYTHQCISCNVFWFYKGTYAVKELNVHMIT